MSINNSKRRRQDAVVVLLSYECQLVSDADGVREQFSSIDLLANDKHGMVGAALASVSWEWHATALEVARGLAGDGWIALVGPKSYFQRSGKRRGASATISDFAELENPRDPSIVRCGVVHVPGPIVRSNVGREMPSVAICAGRVDPVPSKKGPRPEVYVMLDTPGNRKRLLARSGWRSEVEAAWSESCAHRSARRLFSTRNESATVTGSIVGTDIYSAESTARALALVSDSPDFSLAEIIADPLLGDGPQPPAMPASALTTITEFSTIRERSRSESLVEVRIDGLRRAYAAIRSVLPESEPWHFSAYHKWIKDPGVWKLRFGPSLEDREVGGRPINGREPVGLSEPFFVAFEVRKYEARCVVGGGLEPYLAETSTSRYERRPLPAALAALCFSTTDIGLPPLGWNDVLDEGTTKSSRRAGPEDYRPFAVEVNRRLRENGQAIMASSDTDVEDWLRSDRHQLREGVTRRWQYELPDQIVELAAPREWREAVLERFPNSVLWHR